MFNVILMWLLFLSSGHIFADYIVKKVVFQHPEMHNIDTTDIVRDILAHPVNEDAIQSIREKLARRYIQKHANIDSIDFVYNESTRTLTIQPVFGDPIIIQKVIYDGPSKLKTPDLTKSVESMLNQPLSLQQIYDLSKSLTLKLREAGYVFSQVIIKPQDFSNNTLTIHLKSGKIHDIIFKNTLGERENTVIKKYIDNFLADQPLHYSVLEKELAILRDVTGFDYDIVLEPAKVPGDINIVITKTSRVMRSRMTLDNMVLNKKFVSPGELTLQAELGLIGNNFHNINMTFATAAFHEMEHYGITHKSYLDTGGSYIIWNLNANHVQFKNGIKTTLGTYPGMPIEFKNSGVSGQLSIHIPTYLSNTHRFSKYFGFFHNGFDVNNLADPTLTSTNDDAVSYFAFGVHSLNQTHNTIQDYSIEAQVGTQVAHLENISDPHADPEYGLIKGHFSLTYAAGNNTQVYFKGLGQYAATRLVTPARFSYGGNVVGRGYDPSELSGSYGWAGYTEVKKHYANGSWSFSPYLFYDLGYVYQNNPTSSAESQKHGSSAGYGIRLNNGRFSSDTMVTITLDRDPQSMLDLGITSPQPRVYWQLTYRT